jgi:hypothetical protein
VNKFVGFVTVIRMALNVLDFIMIPNGTFILPQLLVGGG